MARIRTARLQPTPQTARPVDLREFLLRQNPVWLVEELLRAADADALLAARLQAAAGADRSGVVDLSGLLRELAAAIQPDYYVEYRAVPGYTHAIDRVLDEVQALTDAGFPEAAIEATEHALTLLEEALGQVDDSNGEVGGLAARAQEIHLAACVAARPDPVQLGERLAGWALRSDWDYFSDSATAYAQVLGEAGLRRFEEVVDEQWSALPRLEPGDGDRRWDGNRFRPTYLKESLAAGRGVDALVEVIAHDLSSPYQFWRAAHALAEEGRIEDALGWLDRGQAAFPDNPDSRLAELAADLHARAGRPEAATELAWQQFVERPSLGGYQQLHTFAVAAGTWVQRREQALEVLRAQPKAGVPDADAPHRRPAWGEPAGHSVLVEVLMWENDVDGAWQAAQSGGCTRPLWLTVARARAKTHPADAMPVLRREVLAAIEGASRGAYQAAATLAKELRGYAKRAGRLDGCDEWLRQVRVDNKRRRALQEEFTRAGLPA